MPLQGLTYLQAHNTVGLFEIQLAEYQAGEGEWVCRRPQSAEVIDPFSAAGRAG